MSEKLFSETPQSQSSSTQYTIFLSSLSGEYESLRAKLFLENKPYLWVAEKVRPDLLPHLPSEEIFDACLEALRASELCICLLLGQRRGKHEAGTIISLRDVPTRVSFFEVEVFQAVLHQIPIVFLATVDFDPGPRMVEFLRLLRGMAVGAQWRNGLDLDSLPFHIKDAISQRRDIKRAYLKDMEGAADHFARVLPTSIAKVTAPDASISSLLWTHTYTSDVEPNYDRMFSIRSLLQIAEGEHNPGKKLIRLYLLVRELLSVPIDRADADLLSLWESALSCWWGAASWYGLHCHQAVNVTDTLLIQAKVRSRYRELNPQANITKFEPPFGPLASSYLSLGRLCRTWRRFRLFIGGVKFANAVIATGAEKDPLIYAVRGSLYIELFNPFFALRDFKTLLAYAIRTDNKFVLAEAYVYLGRIYGKLFRPKKALRFLLSAVDLWREDIARTDRNHTFLIKALKHLAFFYTSRRCLLEARKAANEALELSKRYSVTDQHRQIQELLKRIE